MPRGYRIVEAATGGWFVEVDAPSGASYQDGPYTTKEEAERALKKLRTRVLLQASRLLRG